MSDNLKNLRNIGMIWAFEVDRKIDMDKFIQHSISKGVLIRPINKAPNKHPRTVPTPPITLIPPTTQAEMTVSSKPIAICVEATEYRATHKYPQSPANRPEIE